MNDEEIVVVYCNGDLQIKNIYNKVQIFFIQEFDMQVEELEKGGYEYFMLKEIYQQF